MTHREIKSTKNPLLRHQVGIIEIRPSMLPIYEGIPGSERLVCHTPSAKETSAIFVLQGYGETREAAFQMAQKGTA